MTFIALTLCLCLMPMFAGCDLIVTNMAKYLSQPVASIDNTTEISMEELLNTYNSYGHSQFDGSGEPTKDGVESTIDLLVSRAIFVDYCTDPDKSGEYCVTLTMKQQNAIWQNVYDTINDSIRAIENELREKDGKTIVTAGDDESDDADDAKKYTAYEKTYTYNSSTGVLSKVEKNTEIENVSIAPYDTTDEDITEQDKAKDIYKNFRENHWNYTDSKINPLYADNETSYSDRAFSKYINNLIKNKAEKERNFDTSNEYVLMREVESLYKNNYENAVFQAYQENYSKDIAVTVDKVVQKYTELYDAQQELFDARESNYDTAKKSTSTAVYYEKNPTDWFRVSHILISDEDESRDVWETKLKNGAISKADYDREIAKLDEALLGKANNVLNKLNTALAGKNAAARYEIFRDYAFEYSTDTNSLGTEMDMNIPADATKDQMVKPFANASRELRAEGNKGDITGLVKTDYGYHIIMYLGEYENINPTLGTDALMARLDSTLLSYLSNKTMLDKVIEQIKLETYSQHEQSMIEQLKSEASIVYYVDAYKGMYS